MTAIEQPITLTENTLTANDVRGTKPMDLIIDCFRQDVTPWTRIFKGKTKKDRAEEAARYLCNGVNTYTGKDSYHKYVLYFEGAENKPVIKRRTQWLEQMHTDDATDKAVKNELRKKPAISGTSWEPFSMGAGDDVERIAAQDYGVAVNTFTLGDIEPAEGSVQPFIDHLRYLCEGNKEYAQHILNWMAWKVQHPTKKLRHALVIGSKREGTGKTFLAECLVEILGGHNCSTGDLSKVLGDKTDLLYRKQMVVVEEVRDMKGAQANKLKPLITNDTIAHDLKHKDIKAGERNYADFIFTSNHEDAVYALEGARRYFFIFSYAEPKDVAYYDELWAWKDHGGLEALAHYLLHLPLDGFSPTKPPPVTEAMERAKEYSQPPLELALREHLGGRKALTVTEAMDVLEPTTTQGKGDPQSVAKALRRIGYTAGSRKMLKDGTKPTLYFLEQAVSVDEAWALVRARQAERGSADF